MGHNIEHKRLQKLINSLWLELIVALYGHTYLVRLFLLIGHGMTNALNAHFIPEGVKGK